MPAPIPASRVVDAPLPGSTWSRTDPTTGHGAVDGSGWAGAPFTPAGLEHGRAARVLHRRRTRRRVLALGVALAVLSAGLIVALVALAGLAPGSFGADGVPGGSTVSADRDGEAFGVDDGYIDEGEGVSAFADDLPAIANLEPALRAAMQAAAVDAESDGVTFVVTNGWRSARYQQTLLDEAVQEYGSLEAARRLVATPESSKHVTGEAVDIGFTDADSWLMQHGDRYGLCQTYANEMWHFELATTPGGECPAQLSDASAG